MKKINFLSGSNAKLALAAFAVASFTLTSCEKENFGVEVPDITIEVPDVNIPEAEAGVAYVILSTASANGNTLSDVIYDVTNNGGEKITDEMYKFTTAGSLTVIASKESYESVVKTITVPAPQKGSYQTFNLNFVLNAVSEDITVEPGEDLTSEAPNTAAAVTQSYSEASLLTAGEHTVEVDVPTGLAYTNEQKAALLEAVDNLTGPTSRAANDEAKANLETAKSTLKTMINKLRSDFGKTKHKVTYTLSSAASSLKITTTPKTKTVEVEISVTVANQDYVVKGAATEATGVESFGITADGVNIGHGHDHGNSENAGGGTGE